jgi:hypothetical protein
MHKSVKLTMAGIGCLAVLVTGVGCGNAAAPAPQHSAPPHAAISQQQKASGDAASQLAQDDKARAAFEARWHAIDFGNASTIGTQLTSLAKFTGTLTASTALKSAMFKLVGDTTAFYFGTKNVPTQAQIQADANAVTNTI